MWKVLIVDTNNRSREYAFGSRDEALDYAHIIADRLDSYADICVEDIDGDERSIHIRPERKSR